MTSDVGEPPIALTAIANYYKSKVVQACIEADMHSNEVSLS